MAKYQIILLVVVILVTVYLLSLLIKYEVKKKPKASKKAKEPAKEKIDKTSAEKPQEKEIVVEKQEQISQQEKSAKTPDISVALLDELHEFQNYLKERVTPEAQTEQKGLHPYDTPRFSALDDSFANRRKNDYFYSNFDDLDDDFDDFPIRERRKESRQDTLENLPNEIKILMMTDFFDTKF